jgi:hypothetical protein
MKIRRHVKKGVAILSALILLLAVAPEMAPGIFAASEGNVIDLSDGSLFEGASGVGWTYSGGVYTITDSAIVTVKGDNGGSQRRVEVAANATADITLNGVTIGGLDTKQSPLFLNNGANVNLTLTGTNRLTAGNEAAGIQTLKGRTITISGTGNLYVHGGDSSAGIGGGIFDHGGAITISGGTITATGGEKGAGIGGGDSGDGGTITISGGTITANGGSYGAGIGGGPNGGGGAITISGGTITATGGEKGAGIGGGFDDDGGAITISGGTVTANGGPYGAGIGDGYDGNGGTFAMDGDAFVVASSVSDTSDKTRGILFNGAGGNFYGASVTLSGNATISAGKTLTVPVGATLTIPAGVTLDIAGTLSNNGAVNIKNGGVLNNKGMLENPGTLHNEGAIENEGEVIVEDGGTLDNSGTFDNDGAVTVENGGALTGGGTVNGSKKFAGANVSVPTVLGTPAQTAITVNAASLLAATGQDIEYAIAGTGTAPTDASAWQAGTTFTDLTSDTVYYVFARSKANARYDAGAPSVSVPVLSAQPTPAKPPDVAALPEATVTVGDKVWTGRQIAGGLNVSLTYRIDGRTVTQTLSPATDYTISNPGPNRDIGKGSVTLTGKPGGAYKGSKALTFHIVPKAPAKVKLAATKKALKVTWSKPARFKAQKLTGYQVRYRYKEGAKWTAWKTKTYKVSAKAQAKTVTRTIKRLKAKKRYEIQIRAYKKTGNAIYPSAWTKTATQKTK